MAYDARKEFPHVVAKREAEKLRREEDRKKNPEKYRREASVLFACMVGIAASVSVPLHLPKTLAEKKKEIDDMFT